MASLPAQQNGAEVRLDSIAIRNAPFDAPWDWLAAGWRDLWAAPRIGLTYGAVFAGLAVLLSLGLLQFGMQSLILALGGGFLLIAPLTAVGLYETSRRLQTGEPIDAGAIVGAGLRAPGQLAFFGAILAFAYIIWLQLAFLLFMLFVGSRGIPPASEFLQTLLFTPHGLGLLIVGTAVGGVLAVLVFTISVVSVPLMMTHRVGVVTAMTVSAQAVVRNIKPMALWAALIAGFMMLGISSMFIGLVIIFPLIGHATWHAYRSMIAG